MTRLLQLCSLSVSSLIMHRLPLALSYSLLMVQTSLQNAENLERNRTAPKSLAALRNDDLLHIVSCKNRYFKLQLWQLPRDGETHGDLLGVRHSRGPTQRSGENDIWRNKLYCRLLCLVHLTFVYHGMPIFCGILQISISENKTKQKPWLTFTKTSQWRWIWKKINIEMQILLNKW